MAEERASPGNAQVADQDRAQRVTRPLAQQVSPADQPAPEHHEIAATEAAPTHLANTLSR